jgi:hypothetical protein
MSTRLQNRKDIESLLKSSSSPSSPPSPSPPSPPITTTQAIEELSTMSYSN